MKYNSEIFTNFNLPTPTLLLWMFSPYIIFRSYGKNALMSRLKLDAKLKKYDLATIT